MGRSLLENRKSNNRKATIEKSKNRNIEKSKHRKSKIGNRNSEIEIRKSELEHREPKLICRNSNIENHVFENQNSIFHENLCFLKDSDKMDSTIEKISSRRFGWSYFQTKIAPRSTEIAPRSTTTRQIRPRSALRAPKGHPRAPTEAPIMETRSSCLRNSRILEY